MRKLALGALVFAATAAQGQTSGGPAIWAPGPTGITSGTAKVIAAGGLYTTNIWLQGASGGNNFGLQLFDSSSLTANHSLTLNNGNADRVLALSGGNLTNSTATTITGTDNRVLQGTGSAASMGQIDDPDFFTTGAAAGTGAIGIVTTGAQSFTGAKTFDGSTDVVQLTVEGHSTQTSDVMDVRKSDGTTMLLQVTNTAGTAIRGTTTNTAACTGCVGQRIDSTSMSNTTLATSATDVTGSSLSLTPGAWQVFYSIEGEADTPAVSGDRTLIEVSVFTSGNVQSTDSYSRIGAKATANVINIVNARLTGTTTVNINANTTYKLRGLCTNTGAAGLCSALVGTGTAFYGIRIY